MAMFSALCVLQGGQGDGSWAYHADVVLVLEDKGPQLADSGSHRYFVQSMADGDQYWISQEVIYPLPEKIQGCILNGEGIPPLR